MAGSCEHCDEPSGFIKCGEFSDNGQPAALQVRMLHAVREVAMGG